MKYAIVLKTAVNSIKPSSVRRLTSTGIRSKQAKKSTWNTCSWCGTAKMTSVGTPLVEGARVHATVIGQVKGPKLVVFSYKPKERIRVKTGHRQHYTRLHIDAIEMK